PDGRPTGYCRGPHSRTSRRGTRRSCSRPSAPPPGHSRGPRTPAHPPPHPSPGRTARRSAPASSPGRTTAFRPRTRNRSRTRSSCISASPPGSYHSTNRHPPEPRHHPHRLPHDGLVHLALSFGPIHERDGDLLQPKLLPPRPKRHLDLESI